MVAVYNRPYRWPMPLPCQGNPLRLRGSHRRRAPADSAL